VTHTYSAEISQLNSSAIRPAGQLVPTQATARWRQYRQGCLRMSPSCWSDHSGHMRWLVHKQVHDPIVLFVAQSCCNIRANAKVHTYGQPGCVGSWRGGVVLPCRPHSCNANQPSADATNAWPRWMACIKVQNTQLECLGARHNTRMPQCVLSTSSAMMCTH
jgi:hypothetical protein